jgi:AcrR family transcriptional regulator
MQKRTVDRRTQRTRQSLMSAFVNLLLETGYENFTLADVAARANVGRSTLYTHYAGKDELLKECISRPSAILASVVEYEVTASMIAPIIEHFVEQRTLNGIFFKVPVRLIWVRNLAGLIEPKVARRARDTQARPLLAAKLIAQSLAEMQIALVANCLAAHHILKSEAVAEAVIVSSRAMLAALLRPGAGSVGLDSSSCPTVTLPPFKTR